MAATPKGIARLRPECAEMTGGLDSLTPLVRDTPSWEISEIASSANAKSDADWKRCPGFFSKQRCTTRCNERGRFGATCEISGGSSFRMALMVSGEVGLWNARLAVNISYRIAPKAKMSAR